MAKSYKKVSLKKSKALKVAEAEKVVVNNSADELIDGDMLFGASTDVVALMKAGGDIKLEEDLVYDKRIQLTKGVDTVIDMNGFSITDTGDTSGDVFQIQNTKVTFKNGTINEATNPTENSAVLLVYKGSTVILENINIKAERCIYGNGAENTNIIIKSGNYVGRNGTEAVFVFRSGTKVTIEGGVFSNETDYNGKKFVLNLYDPLVTPDIDVRQYIEVKGGIFINFNPSKAFTEPAPHNPCNFVADGYVTGVYVIGEDRYYIVMKDSDELPKTTEDGHKISWLNKTQPKNRLNVSAPEVEINNLAIDADCEIYNVVECDKVTPIKSLKVSKLNISVPYLAHNIINGYVFADDAEITISDCNFNINPETTNPLRLCNMQNAKNVTVNFVNVNWTYEDAKKSDYQYAGLVLYQPAKTDLALNGDTEAIDTWTFVFKNCKYNGEVVNEINFGKHNQVIYAYGINNENKVQNIAEVTKANVIFE